MLPPGGLPTTPQSQVPNPDVARTLLQLLLKRYLSQGTPTQPSSPPVMPSSGAEKEGAAQQFLMNLLLQAKKYPGMEVPGYSTNPFSSAQTLMQAPTSDQTPVISPPMGMNPSQGATIGPPGASNPAIMSLLRLFQGNLPSLPPGDVAGQREGRM
jgi:hypothetical protein